MNRNTGAIGGSGAFSAAQDTSGIEIGLDCRGGHGR
jgi:hypothetical protein